MKVKRVCGTEEECRLLHAAIADFSPDGARADYAQWLASRGEAARSRVVTATIEAYQTLDAKDLPRTKVDDGWAELVGLRLLRTFIEVGEAHDRKSLLALRNQLFARLRPALELSFTKAREKPKVGTSYLWGTPDLPKEDQWPRTNELSNWFKAKAKLPQDRHCGFLGQISFQELRGTLLAEELPRDGGFSVFAFSEVYKLGITETVVRPWKNRASLERREPPADLLEDELGEGVNAPKPPHSIHLKERLSLPYLVDGPFAEEIRGCRHGEPFYELFGAVQNRCVQGLGGYLTGTSGGDPSPNTRSLRLAVLATTPDAGLVHLAIPARDLVKGQLDRVKYVWNDFD